MAPLKLYTYPNNKNAYKALIAAKYGDVKVELPKFEMRQTNATSEFKEMSPAGKVSRLLQFWDIYQICHLTGFCKSAGPSY